MIKAARNNQSLLDMILEGCGTMEAAMQVAVDNGLPVSYMPAIGYEVAITDAALVQGNSLVLRNLTQNGILIGTKGFADVPTRLITEDVGATIIAEDGSEIFASED